MFIAGDVGGTKTRLGLFTRARDGSLQLITSERYKSSEYPSLESIVTRFLEEQKKHLTKPLESGCFGIPGPVVKGRVKVTNLPWEVVADDMASHLNIKHVKLVNDLVSTAAALPVLSESGTLSIYKGEGAVDPESLIAVVAPGTGLGHAFVCRQGGKAVYLPSEGGHANFAPSNEREWRLFQYLSKKYSHVSVESVICGPGLANIYDFLKNSEKIPESPELKAEFEAEDRGSVLTKHALAGSAEICVETLKMFCAILGSHCSNVVLSFLATGGVYLGGGIPPKIAPFLLDGPFLEGYFRKDKCIEEVKATSVSIIKDDSASLIGAAHLAASLLE